MTTNRRLDWDGCFNVRDLGGLPAAGGRFTRFGAVVRSDSVNGLTEGGWSALYDYGVRTVVDLRCADERQPDAAQRPSGVTSVHVPLESRKDTGFWVPFMSNGWWATPLYYPAFLARFARRTAPVLASVARAGSGGVLVHCAVGRDRTGLVSMLLLALAGVSAVEIAADYALSTPALRAAFAARGEPDQAPLIEHVLSSTGISVAEAISDTLSGFDVAGHLKSGGLADADLTVLRSRLLG